MNERIQALAIAASADLDPEDYMGASEEFLELFTKLIVEECMWKIMTRKEEAIDNNWRVDEAMSAVLSDISEHFGVEE
jgi:hypothetical protein